MPTYSPADWAEQHRRSALAFVGSSKMELEAHLADYDGNWSKTIHLANECAKAAGRRDAAAQCERFATGLSNGLSLVQVLAGIAEYISTVSRDDGWSGQGNDGKRAYRDGFLTVMQAFASEIIRD